MPAPTFIFAGSIKEFKKAMSGEEEKPVTEVNKEIASQNTIEINKEFASNDTLQVDKATIQQDTIEKKG